MSTYGLIKATSYAMRCDTITDLGRLNTWLVSRGANTIVTYGPSLRRLENAVALGVEATGFSEDTHDAPKLERGIEFYRSLIPEISENERKQWKFKQDNR